MFYRHATLHTLTAIFALLLLSACSSGIKPNTTDIPLATVSVDDIVLDEYQIGVGDGLTVSVWRNPDLSAQVVVLPDGNISVPLVGDVRAAGTTTRSLAGEIETALNDFIREPKVTVSVVSASSSEYLQRVRITGAVNSPQSIRYRRGLTILDVVLLAGGVSPFGNGNKATLYRTQQGEVKVFRVNIDDILSKGKLETNYLLLPADVITVPEKNF